MSEGVLKQQLDRSAALIGWGLAFALGGMTWIGWVDAPGGQRLWLAMIALGLFLGTWLLQQVMPEASRGGIAYSSEDKALAASLLQLGAVAAWLFIRVDQPSGSALLFALPIVAATMLLHERVVLAETAFAIGAMVVLRMASRISADWSSPDFFIELGLFSCFGLAMAVLSRKLRLTLRKSGQLMDELSRRLDQMQIVGVLARQVEFFTQFDTLLDRTAEIVAGAFNAERYGVFLVDAETGALGLRGQTYGFGPSEREMLELEHSIAPFREVAADKRPRLFGSEEISGNYGVLSSQTRVFNMMAAPLKARRGIVGVAFVANKRGLEFNQDDLSYFDMLAGYISTLVDSAELFQRAVTEQHTVEKMARLMVGREVKMREMKRMIRGTDAS